jgi:hypothetical protein
MCPHRSAARIGEVPHRLQHYHHSCLSPSERQQQQQQRRRRHQGRLKLVPRLFLVRTRIDPQRQRRSSPHLQLLGIHTYPHLLKAHSPALLLRDHVHRHCNSRLILHQAHFNPRLHLTTHITNLEKMSTFEPTPSLAFSAPLLSSQGPIHSLPDTSPSGPRIDIRRRRRIFSGATGTHHIACTRSY